MRNIILNILGFFPFPDGDMFTTTWLSEALCELLTNNGNLFKMNKNYYKRLR